jgi:hypothetical protein
MKLRDIDIIKEEFIDELVLWELNNMLKDAKDSAVISSLHVVIAYCSVPGTYMEGAYDSTDDS